LIAGLVYQQLGGMLPLIYLEPHSWLPLAGLFVTNFIIYEVLILARAYGSIRDLEPTRLIDALPGMFFGEIFSLPLSIILSIAYYELSVPAFALIFAGCLIAGLLFRISERSRWTLQRRSIELETLNSIGQSLTTSLDMTDLMQSLYRQISRLMDAQTFYTVLYNFDNQTLSYPLVIQDNQRIEWSERPAAEDGLSDYIMRTGKSLQLSGSLKAEAAKLGINNVILDAASYVAVPLTAGEGVMGVLAIANDARTNAYGPSEVDLLTTAASQAAVSIRNTNLYSRVWEMADELALLNNVSSVVTATLDLHTVLDTTCSLVIRVGHADKTAIFLVGEDTTSVRLEHSIGLTDDFAAQFQQVRLDDNSGPSQVLGQNTSMAISDVMTDVRALGWRSLAELEGYAALLTVPLIANNQTIGFLAAFYEQPHVFSKSEQDLMNTLANQVAVTVANARLYDDTQVRAQAMSMLVEASRAFTASLDLNSVAQKVLDELARVLIPDMSALLLIGPRGELSLPLAQRGIQLTEPLEPSGSIARAISNGKAAMLPDSTDDLALLRRFELQSMYVLPLAGPDQMIGIVLIGHKEARRLSDRERQLAEALVNQAATALRNAQLYSHTDAALAARVAELSAIEAISRQISGTLDLEAIINDVLDLAIVVTQADAAGCGLVSGSEYLSFIERYPKASEMMQLNQIIDRRVGVAGRVLKTGQIEMIGDVRDDPDYWRGNLSGMLSELCVPIRHNDRRVGVINLESRRLNAFNDFHKRFMINLADHAAIAIENARLFEERQLQIDTLIKFRNLSLDLLGATSLQEVMNLAVEYAMIIAHAKDSHLYLYDRSTGTLTFGASLWLDGRENVEAAKPRREGQTWQVALSGQMHLIEDTSRLLKASLSFSGPPYGAMARIPLKRAGQTLGVLNIAYREPHYFTESEIRAFDLLANQVAIAIENVRLFDEVRRSHDQMRVILDSTRDGVILVGQHGELVLANPAAERLLNFPFPDYLGRNLLRLALNVQHNTSKPNSLDSLFKGMRQILTDIRSVPDAMTSQTFQIPAGEETRDIEATALPVRNDQGNVAGRLVVLRDVSDEKSVERFREELTNMIVHDLRSPLTAVISSLHLLEDMFKNSSFADFEAVIGIALTSSENQMRMIVSMLEIDKLEKKTMPLQLEVVPIKPLVDKAMSAMAMLANTAKINMIDCVPEDLPELQIDEEQIRRVLVNLLDNAVRHTPSGGEVRIDASIIENNGHALIGVTDTGKGIPPERREDIFKKFVQLPKSAIRGQRGMGLGLTFCKLAVEAHGGRIWVENGPEGGAAFWFTVPIAKAKKS
jgi:GAF domain-containing protein/signal transduction histidine kinase